MIYDLTELGLLRVEGEQAKKFLQGQLTCNMDDITTTQSRMGAHCNPQGRIISLFHIFLYQNDYYLQMPRGMIPVAMQALQKYSVFFKVKLTDASDVLKQSGIVENELLSMPQAIHSQVTLDQLVVIRMPGTPARYQLMGEPESIEAFQKNLAGASSDFNAWKTIDITEKIPAIYPETSEKFLPHDLDLPTLNAISFNKGCYTGQEIIARIQYRGKLKKHLQLGKTRTELRPTRGSEVDLEDKSSGELVDFCEIDYNVYLVLVIKNK